MNPPYQQVTFGNQQHPPAAPGPVVNPTRPDERLWGSNVRRSMGIIQIICGGIGFALGIAAICIPTLDFDRLDRGGFGMWTGMFAIVTGFVGVYSLTKRCMVTAYLITSIITAVLCGGCFVYGVYGAWFANWYDRCLFCRNGSYTSVTANLAVYIIMCIVFFIHMVISIIGASFTCGAFFSAIDHPQQVVYYTSQPLLQPNGPTPPYTVAASPSDITSQTTTPGTNGDFVPPKI